MSLDQYRTRRHFDRTPEPEGDSDGRILGLAFVIQKHQASHLHYDFRLEMNDVLVSWAVPKGPSTNPEDKHLALKVEDHPYDYRTFEGAIPQGEYGGGTVMIWDEGTFSTVEPTGDIEADEKSLRQGLHRGHITIILHGKKLHGEWALIRMKDSEDNAWMLVKAADRYATTNDVLDQDRSAQTGRTMEEISRADATWTHTPDLSASPEAPMPDSIAPMLATLSDEPFDSDDWLFEIKWDGYRSIAFINDGEVRLRSRRDQDFNPKYPNITEAHRAVRGTTAVLDGEIVALDSEGRSNFGALQDYASGKSQICYYVFDLLYLDGRDLTGLPLVERKSILRQWFPFNDLIRYSDHVIGQGRAFYEATGERQLEGIIAKRADSRYEIGKRSQAWLKLKHLMSQEAVIGGFTAPRGSRTGFGALVLGIYEGDDLKYIGNAGTGFDDKSLKSLHDKLRPISTDSSPFAGNFKVNSPVTYVEPELACEVKFTEWTSDGRMRHPVFIGLRSDKYAKSVIRETPAPPEDISQPKLKKSSNPSEKLTLTNQDKVFWPDEGFTKGDLIEYYRAISPYILPYLEGRPQSLNRFPNGIAGQSFYQKDMAGVAPDWAETVVVHSDSEVRDLEYLICSDLDTLLYIVNLGAIEINPWNSRVGSLDNPDWCVIDLDPEGVDFEAVITVAQCVCDVLETADIPSYPKTSGASGLHIYIPLGARYNYEQTKDFAHVIAQMANARLPQLTSLERSPAKRQERVYLDYLQNRRGQTLAAPYCVRPKPGMPVSTPLEWDEVGPGLKPTDFTVHTIRDRLETKGDLWQPVIGEGIDMMAALERLASI